MYRETKTSAHTRRHVAQSHDRRVHKHKHQHVSSRQVSLRSSSPALTSPPQQPYRTFGIAQPLSYTPYFPMKVTVKHWHAIAQWRWDTGSTEEDDGECDVCGICRVAYEGCCPTCKMPGDDCPLSEYHTSLDIVIMAYVILSLGRMYPCLSHALFTQMDRHSFL